MRMPAVVVGVVHQGGAVPFRRVVPHAQAAHEVCSVCSLELATHVPVVALARAVLLPLPHRPVLALLVPRRVLPLPTPRLIVAKPLPVVKRFTCLVALTSNQQDHPNKPCH